MCRAVVFSDLRTGACRSLVSGGSGTPTDLDPPGPPDSFRTAVYRTAPSPLDPPTVRTSEGASLRRLKSTPELRSKQGGWVGGSPGSYGTHVGRRGSVGMRGRTGEPLITGLGS